MAMTQQDIRITPDDLLTASLGIVMLMIGAFTLIFVIEGVDGNQSVLFVTIAFISGIFSVLALLLVYRAQANEQKVAEIMELQNEVMKTYQDLIDEYQPDLEIKSWGFLESQTTFSVLNKGHGPAKNLKIRYEVYEGSEETGEELVREFKLPLFRNNDDQEDAHVSPNEDLVRFQTSDRTWIELDRPISEAKVLASLTYEDIIGNRYNISVFSLQLEHINEGSHEIRNLLEDGDLDIFAAEPVLHGGVPGPIQSTVMVVEDEAAINQAVSNWLADEYQVISYRNGEDALEQVNDQIDVIVLDRLMPGFSGDEFLHEIRRNGYDTPVVMFSAIEPEEYIIDMDFDIYLNKPASEEEILNAVSLAEEMYEYPDDIREYIKLSIKERVLESSMEEEELNDVDEFKELKSRKSKLENSIKMTHGIDIETIDNEIKIRT